jgi:FtsH-binding integral membrane protein
MRTMPKAPEGPYTTINEQPNYNSNNVIEAKVVNDTNNDFTLLTPISSSEVRTNFISKVYSILWLQLMITSIYIGCCNQLEPVQKFMLSPVGYSLMFPAAIILLIMTCMLSCYQNTLRTKPYSFIYLSVFTILMSYIVGYTGIAYKLNTLLLSGISTLSIFSGLSIYAIQTKYDYTDKGGYLLAGLFGLILLSIFVSFTSYNTISIAYAVGGSVLFSFYIVYDTQLIVGGEHKKIMFHTDDYVLASVSLYLDVINLFLMILRLLNGERE